MKEIGVFLKDVGTYLGMPAEAVAVLLFLIAIGYWRYGYHRDTLKGLGGRADVRERLEKHGSWREAYFGGLRRGLAWVDGKLGTSAWSAESYDFALRMAFVYPIASLVIIWMFTGQNTSGIEGLLAEDISPMQRVLAVGLTVLSAAMFYASRTSKGWRQWAYIPFAFAFAFAGAGAFAFASALASVVVSTVAFASAVAVAVAGAVAGAFAGAFAGAVAGAFAGAFAAAVAGAFANTFIVAVGSAGALAGVVAIVYLQMTMDRFGRLGLFYLLYGISMFLTLGALGHYARPLNLDSQGAKTFLIFLALLPLTNSIFDWLSLAATRRLLCHVAEGKLSNAQVAAKALTSLVIGIALLVALAMTCTAAVQTMNLLSQSNGGPQFLDVAWLLQRLHTAPNDPAVWWVYFTLFSTMLPTLVHVLVASASFVTWRLPDRFRQSWLAKIDIEGHPNTESHLYDPKEHHPLLVGMALRLTALDAATLILTAFVCALLTVLGWLVLPGLAQALLSLCEWIALALHA
jgi:hypothetical protein